MLIPDAPQLDQMSDGMKPVPEAAYNLRVSKTEYVAVPKTAGAKGPYIKAQLTITGPTMFKAGDGTETENPYIGRLVFMNYSMTGDGSFRLRELLEVTGHPADFKLTDSDQLLNLEFGGAVTIQKGTNGYSDKNEVKKHLALLG